MNWLASLAAPLMRGLVWFFVAVVIPVTTWFLVLRFDADANAQDIADVQREVAAIKVRLDAKEEMLAEKLEAIQRSLGRIEGRLRDHN
jgi:hypothetical protein